MIIFIQMLDLSSLHIKWADWCNNSYIFSSLNNNMQSNRYRWTIVSQSSSKDTLAHIKIDACIFPLSRHICCVQKFRKCRIYTVNLLNYWYDWVIFVLEYHVLTVLLEMLKVGDCGCPGCHFF